MSSSNTKLNNILNYITNNSKSIHFICDASIILIFNISILIKYGFLFYIPLLIYMIMDEESVSMKYFIYTYLTILSYLDISLFIIFICLNISNIIITFNYSINEEIDYFMNVVKSLTDKLNELINNETETKEENLSNDENETETKKENLSNENNENLNKKENTDKIRFTKNFIRDLDKPFSNTLDNFCSTCNNVFDFMYATNENNSVGTTSAKNEKENENEKENNINVDSPEHQNKCDGNENENIIIMNKGFETEYNNQLNMTVEEKERRRKENMNKVQKYFEEQQKKRKEEEEKFKEYEKEMKNKTLELRKNPEEMAQKINNEPDNNKEFFDTEFVTKSGNEMWDIAKLPAITNGTPFTLNNNDDIN